jgi:predicted SAM-dependent methyltransferase
MMGDIKLNLGSGNTKKEGFTNVDIHKFSNVDIVHDMEKRLPFKNDTVSEIYSHHSLEHCRMHKIKEILKDWYRVLKKDGILKIIVPEITSCMKTFLEASETDPEKWRWKISYIMGGIHKQYDRDFHKSAFTEYSLKKVVEKAGFVIQDVHLVETTRNDCIHLTAIKN